MPDTLDSVKRHKRRHPDKSSTPPAASHVSRAKPPNPKSPPSSDAPFQQSKGKQWLLGLLLVVGVILAYQKAWNAGFIWDDDAYVTGNYLLTAPDGWWKMWFSTQTPSQYFPMVYSTLRIEHSLWGMNAAGYHWVNILLHAANAVLVWRVLRRLRLPGCWLAAALFALHPVNVESVAWITERKNVLSLLFSLLSVMAWIRFIEGPRRNDAGSKWKWIYGLTLLFYAMALLSKTTACTLPAAYLLILWLKRMPINWRRLAQMVPFVLMGIVMGLVSIWWERNNMGVTEKLQALTIPERILVASHAVWFYLGKLLWPSNLTFSYPRWTLNPADPLAYGWLAALIGLGTVIFFARRRLGRGPEAAALFYVATLSPLLGFVMLVTFRWSFVADHYQYVASIGPFALIAAGLTAAISVLQRKWPPLKPVILGALLALLGTLTWWQCRMYKDEKTLWQVTLERNPQSWMAHMNLGKIILHEGGVDESIGHFQNALALNPGNAAAYYNLGMAALQSRPPDEAKAMEYFRTAIQLQPRYAEALNNLGAVLYRQGRDDEAISNYLAALEAKPLHSLAHYNLAAALQQKGRLDEAIAHYQKAIEIEPGYAEAHSGWGNILSQKGSMPEAIVQYEKANHIAWTWATSPDASIRNGARAVQVSRELDRIAGGNHPLMLQTLAAGYAETGLYTEAVAAAQRALQLLTVARQDSTPLADALRRQLETYRSSRPFRDPSATRIPQ